MGKIITGAEIVIEELVRHGVETVFGYPGGYVLNIYDELYKNSDRISHILTAHEQGAAHAADAFARVTGKTSAVIATSGPGATNLVTGIANANLDSVPVVFITGNVPVPMLGQDSFQEIDILGVTMPIVKHSYVVKDIARLQYTLREAFSIAGTGRKGPVLVDIPKCVQVSKFEYIDNLHVPTSEKALSSADFANIDRALAAIGNSKRPYIYCGGGVTAAGAGAGVVALSEKLGAPVGMSVMGIGSVPYSYELCLGMSGIYGRYASTAAEAEADLIIALGARFSDRATGSTGDYAKNAAVIHIDIDAAEMNKNIRSDISICGNIKEILPHLIDESDACPNEQWLSRVRELKAEGSVPPGDDFTPRNIIERVGRFCGDDTIVATDVGQHQMWVAQYYKFEKPRKLITSGGLGAMGFGFGAAIGACIASGRQRTLLFTSDGSFGMNLIEMATAVTYELPITIVVLNNGVLGLVRQMQEQFFDGRYSQTTLERKTDFSALATSFGASGSSAKSLDELDCILARMPENGPYLIDCKIDKNEKVYPVTPAVGTIRRTLF